MSELLTPSKCGRQVFGRYDDGTVSVHKTGTMDVGLVLEQCGIAKYRFPNSNGYGGSGDLVIS